MKNASEIVNEMNARLSRANLARSCLREAQKNLARFERLRKLPKYKDNEVEQVMFDIQIGAAKDDIAKYTADLLEMGESV